MSNAILDVLHLDQKSEGRRRKYICEKSLQSFWYLNISKLVNSKYVQKSLQAKNIMQHMYVCISLHHHLSMSRPKTSLHCICDIEINLAVHVRKQIYYRISDFLCNVYIYFLVNTDNHSLSVFIWSDFWSTRKFC